MPEKLASQFAAEGVTFSMQENLMMINVENDFATATITTHGASVLSFIPKGGKDLLWVSPTAIYSGEKPVRGGVPVCWPWFGAGKQAGLPAHGFVRNQEWQLDRVANLDSGVTEIILSFEPNEASLEMWPHQFHLSLCIEVGEKLAVSLTTVNKNDHDLEITEALHTYFSVAESAGLLISGIENATEHNTLAKPVEITKCTQAITLVPPMDSVFTNQTAELVIHDEKNARNIVIEKECASSAVVWNPGAEIIKGFADVPEQCWSDFVCVEAGNVLENSITIPAGQKHTMRMVLSTN